METSKKYYHCLSKFDEFFVYLRLQFAVYAASSRHIEDERQILRYLILKIWTIFETMQITSNGAHAKVYVAAHKGCHIYQSVSFLLVIHSWQSRASVW